jgi:hypothetical protein
MAALDNDVDYDPDDFGGGMDYGSGFEDGEGEDMEDEEESSSEVGLCCPATFAFADADC